MNFRRVVAAIAALAALVGCSPRSHPSTATSTTSTASNPAVATTTPGDAVTTNATPAPVSTTAPAGPADVTRCPTSGLAVTLTELGVAAGTAYRDLVFKNTSARTCTLQGYPGVSFVDGQGHQIGAPVPRVSGAADPVTLVPGMTAVATIAYHDAYVSTFPACQATAAVGIRVYPPDQKASLIVATNLMVCANPAADGTAGVMAVTPAPVPNG